MALDTATDQLSVALGTPSGEVREATVVGARRHAAELAPVVERLLEQAGARIGDVREFIVSDGPGSFTGLRVAAAFVKALARVGKVPVYTASTLLVRAAGAFEHDPITVGAIGTALRGEVYRAVYRLTPDGASELSAPTTAPIEADWGGVEPEIVIGDLSGQALLQAPWWGRIRYLAPPLGLPRASRLLWLRQVGAARLVGDVSGWEPSYGRPAEAQARWEATHGRSLSGSLRHGR